eukprot:1345788-Amorphochlora_amoeboformis.AAC.1
MYSVAQWYSTRVGCFPFALGRMIMDNLCAVVGCFLLSPEPIDSVDSGVAWVPILIWLSSRVLSNRSLMTV